MQGHSSRILCTNRWEARSVFSGDRQQFLIDVVEPLLMQNKDILVGDKDILVGDKDILVGDKDILVGKPNPQTRAA